MHEDKGRPWTVSRDAKPLPMAADTSVGLSVRSVAANAFAVELIAAGPAG